MSSNAKPVLSTWWTTPPGELAQQLGTDPETGLAPSQVERQRETYGHNRLADTGPTSLWTLLWDSIRSPMILLLLAIAGISLLLGQFREAIVMAFVVATYVAVHLLNKARSDRTMARLREVQAPRARVLRGGQVREILSRDVVVGDVLPLQAGTRVAADGRLISAAGLLADEAALSGESAPVRKDPEVEVGADTPLAERQTAVWAGTTIVDGQGRALVTAVGQDTELGRVAELAAGAGSEPTPLQREMDDLARVLAYVALGVSLLIPAIGALRGFGLQEMILTWLSLTFLMVPGQPPIIIAMALALASLELARKDVIVRRLHGAETLGAVTALLSDKTGTLTENRMALDGVLLPDGRRLEVDSRGTAHGGVDEALARFLRLARRAIPEHPTDPTDQAVEEAAERATGERTAGGGRLVDEVGFARGGSYRALTYAEDSARRTFLAGRPEFLVERSTRKQGADGDVAWPDEEKAQLQERIEEEAAQGRRVTAYARAQRSDSGEDGSGESEPSDLVFVGAAVIADPIRPEVPDAVAQLEGAGIRVLMVTGDVAATAAHVGREVGLGDGRPVTGGELAGQDEAGYEALVRDRRVFCRTTPEQKLHLVQALVRQGEVVGVTGDGVNDAPALRAGQVGIAMGQTGTDVAREAADLVLTDDNFARLPDGVAIGRKAYDNFSKGLTYYLSAKAILLSIFVVPLAVGVPFPLAPIHIILTELLMDLASSTIFVTEEAEPDLLERPPRQRTGYLSWDVAGRIARNAAGLVIAILAVYFGSRALGYGLDSARTAAFATWLLGHIVLAMNLKQRRRPLLRQGLLANRFAAGWLLGMVALVLVMTLAAPVRAVLKTTPLSGLQWLGVVAGALLASGWMEVRKWLAT